MLPVALVTVLLAGVAVPADAAANARASYERALARERALAARDPDGTREAEVRAVSVAFENVARRYPTSGYADNALLKAATLAERLHQRFQREADARRALLLYRWLANEYPASPLVKQARAAARALEGARRDAAPAVSTPKRAVSDPARAAGSAPVTGRDAPPPASLLGSAPEEAALAATGGNRAASAPSVPRLREVRRAVLPEVVRVTLELDGEVAYRHERIEGPPRLFFDLNGVQPVAILQDAVLSWPDDVVRQVRLGRKPEGTTRVVLDLDGVSRYSVFALYNPYRIVVDLERQVGRRAGVVPRAPSPVISVDRSATETAGGLDEPTTPVPANTRGVTPEAPSNPSLGEPRTTGSARATDQVRLTPEHAITSRDIELSPSGEGEADGPAPAPGAGAKAAAGAKVPGKGATAAGRGSRAAPAAKDRATRQPLPASPPPADVSDGTPPDRPQDLQAKVMADAAGTTASPDPAASSAAPAAASLPPAGVAPKAPEANATGGFSLARQLGLGVSRIVIDPGHGGHDPGALGKGVGEAELVLDVALRLEKLLLKQPGMEVVLTRRTDSFVALEERTAIANRQQADLFLSIHANASRNAKARGVETYFLNFASTPDAEAVAARENSASARTMHNLSDIVRAIALNTKLDESRDFASMVQSALVKRLGGQNRQLRDLGVKQAPFVVLIGAAMPSVLAEISFVTHPQEAQLLRSTGYRQRIAEALCDAVLKYQRSLKAVSTVAQQ
jgi:N-acetylmuramoyl-L-alanine amidase